MYSTIILLKTNGLSQGFSSLQAAEDAAAAGDCVVVYPGTYDLGAASLTLKDGVNKKFMPGVTITSSNATATIKDNNVSVTQTWDGAPTIANTGLGVKYLNAHASTKVILSHLGYDKHVIRYTEMGVPLNATLEFVEKIPMPILEGLSKLRFSCRLEGNATAEDIISSGIVPFANETIPAYTVIDMTVEAGGNNNHALVIPRYNGDVIQNLTLEGQAADFDSNSSIDVRVTLEVFTPFLL